MRMSVEAQSLTIQPENITLKAGREMSTAPVMSHVDGTCHV